jgi:tetratricopeptide (TPR) repeat protein
MNIRKQLESAIGKYREGELQQAADLCSAILKTESDNYKALHLLGSICAMTGHYDDAIAYLKKAISLNPSDDGLFYSLGNAFKEKKQFNEAIVSYNKALELNPKHFLAYNNLGLVLQETGDTESAISFYKKALSLNPHLVLAYNNLGLALQESGKYREALEYFDNALKYNPDVPDIRWNRSLSLLYSGDFKNGWKEYEWRWKTKDFLLQECKLPVPLWDGSSLKGKTIFISSEQGVGDEIMFASCFREVIRMAGKCIIECDRRFVPLFARSFPEADFIERSAWQNPDQKIFLSVSVKIPAGSLPGFLRPGLAGFPRQESYLIADPQKVEGWRNRYGKTGKGLKVGISWRGGKNPTLQRIRSTALSRWSELFSIEGLHFINLQYGDCTAEIKEVSEKFGFTIYDWEDADPLKDLDDFAAQIASVDLVISVDNATVHMAGAIGKPVWVLLPVACDWRWMQDVEDSPWYGTVRLFRQHKSGDWNEAFNRIQTSLKRSSMEGLDRLSTESRIR